MSFVTRSAVRVLRIHVNDGPCKSCRHVSACAAPKTRLPERGKSTGAVCVCVCMFGSIFIPTSYSWRQFFVNDIYLQPPSMLVRWLSQVFRWCPEWIVSLCALRDTLKQQHEKVGRIIEWHIGCDCDCFVFNGIIIWASAVSLFSTTIFVCVIIL